MRLLPVIALPDGKDILTLNDSVLLMWHLLLSADAEAPVLSAGIPASRQGSDFLIDHKGRRL
jgi:hypothetical protein